MTWFPWMLRAISRILSNFGFCDLRLSLTRKERLSERGMMCLNKFWRALVPCLLLATWLKQERIFIN